MSDLASAVGESPIGVGQPAGDFAGAIPGAPNPLGTNPVGDDRVVSVMDIPVTLTVVLGEKTIPLGKLYALGRGSIIELDRKVGEPVEIFVNDRLVARGEVQLTEEGRLAIAMTEVASSGLA
jgi:flagellar motor switch protein FliN/FliY